MNLRYLHHSCLSATDAAKEAASSVQETAESAGSLPRFCILVICALIMLLFLFVMQ